MQSAKRPHESHPPRPHHGRSTTRTHRAPHHRHAASSFCPWPPAQLLPPLPTPAASSLRRFQKSNRNGETPILHRREREREDSLSSGCGFPPSLSPPAAAGVSGAEGTGRRPAPVLRPPSPPTGGPPLSGRQSTSPSHPFAPRSISFLAKQTLVLTPRPAPGESSRFPSWHPSATSLCCLLLLRCYPYSRSQDSFFARPRW